MNTKQAILHVLSREDISKYRLAAELGCNPTSVSQWLRGTRMSKPYAKIFKLTYDVTVEDAV